MGATDFKIRGINYIYGKTIICGKFAVSDLGLAYPDDGKEQQMISVQDISCFFFPTVYRLAYKF